jgi:AcrR family transcriptional regulator
VTPAAAAARKAVQTRNATEEAILDAARAALAEKGFEALTMDAIARKAFVSRTAVYFYFPNKRAVVDRLIQQAFSEMYLGASAYLDGEGDPRRELRAGLARVMVAVNRNARVLLLAAQLSGARGEHLPDEWAPYLMRFVERAEARIARDQERGIAPDDIAPRLCAQALLAMVESHITRELVLRRGDVTESIRVLSELWWRAVYSQPADITASVASAS